MPEGPLTEGEAWTRAELTKLRAAGFSPRALAAFLLASQRRANATRRARPALARQALAWDALGAAGWLALARAGVQPFGRRRRLGLAWWAGCALMLDWHLGMVESEDGRARPLSAADALTLGRAWLVPAAWDEASPAVVALAALTDVADGRLARAGTPTRAGRDLEGLADACFAAAALTAAYRQGRISSWAAAAEGARTAAGVLHGFWSYFTRLEAPDPAHARAARGLTPVRAAGLLAAGGGRRRLADALVTGGAVASLAVHARARRATPDPAPQATARSGVPRPIRAPGARK